MAKITGKYEVLYILETALGEEGIAALVEKFKAMVEAEGTLSNIDEWGKRRLAYPINDMTEGYYVLMNMEVKPEFPAELERVMKITEGVLRCLTTVVEHILTPPHHHHGSPDPRPRAAPYRQRHRCSILHHRGGQRFLSQGWRRTGNGFH